MATWHGYIGIENLALNATQKGNLLDALNGLGPGNDPQPARLCHWRTRLDNDARIYEAAFDMTHVDIDGVKTFLANVFGIDPATVNHAVQQTAYGPLVTYERGGTDYLRLVQFGGVGSSWIQSNQAAREYLRDNAAAWGDA